MDDLQINPTEVKTATTLLQDHAASITTARTTCDGLPALPGGNISIATDVQQFRTAWSDGLTQLADAISALAAKTDSSVEVLMATQSVVQENLKSILNLFGGR